LKPQTASRHQLPLKPHRRTQETSDAIAFYASETGFGFSDSGCNITKQRHISKTAWKTTEDLHTKVDDVHHVARLSRVKSAQFCQIALRRIPATYTDKTAGKKTFILVAHGPKLYYTYIPLKTKKTLTDHSELPHVEKIVPAYYFGPCSPSSATSDTSTPKLEYSCKEALANPELRPPSFQVQAIFRQGFSKTFANIHTLHFGGPSTTG